MIRWFPHAVIACAFYLSGPASFAGGDVQIRWTAPGFFYPVLGWRLPVDLSSASDFDRRLAPLPAHRYNCHFYTSAYIRWALGARSLDTFLSNPRHDLVTPETLRAQGLEALAPGSATRPGDIVVAGERNSSALRITHSAVVLAVCDDGRVARVRQKFDPRHPVVDTSWDEFLMLYAGLAGWETQVWRLPEGVDARSLVAR